MKSFIATICILALVGMVVGVAAQGADTVTSTVTPRKISVTITTDGSVPYGIVSLNTTKNTLSPVDTQTAKNDGNDTEKLNIMSSDTTGGTTWELAASAGSNAFVHKFSKDSGANWIQFPVDNSYTEFVASIAKDATQNFDLQITTPIATTDYVEKTITVTVQAIAL